MAGKFARSESATRRQRRVNEFIRRTIADMLARQELPDRELSETPITITEVQASPDLREATVYFLPLGGTGANRAQAALERNRGELQRAVALKFAPKLRFVVDTAFDQADRIQALIDAAKPESSPH